MCRTRPARHLTDACCGRRCLRPTRPTGHPAHTHTQVNHPNVVHMYYFDVTRLSDASFAEPEHPAHDTLGALALSQTANATKAPGGKEGRGAEKCGAWGVWPTRPGPEPCWCNKQPLCIAWSSQLCICWSGRHPLAGCLQQRCGGLRASCAVVCRRVAGLAALGCCSCPVVCCPGGAPAARARTAAAASGLPLLLLRLGACAPPPRRPIRASRAVPPLTRGGWGSPVHTNQYVGLVPLLFKLICRTSSAPCWTRGACLPLLPATCPGAPRYILVRCAGCRARPGCGPAEAAPVVAATSAPVAKAGG